VGRATAVLVSEISRAFEAAGEEADKTWLNPCLRAAVPTVANPIIASMRAKLEVCRNGHCLGR